MVKRLNETGLESGDKRFVRYSVPSDKATEYLKKDPELKKYWKQLNRDTNGEILVDPNTKEQIGYGFVYHSGENKGFIFNIEVMKKFRRQGFGKIILNDCVTKFGGIDLTVACDNTPAIKLYEKYGFEIVDTVKGQNGRDEYYMKLKESKTVQERTTTVIKKPGPFGKFENIYSEGGIMKLKIRESKEDFEVVKRFQVSYIEGEDPYDDSAEIYDDGGGFEIVKDLETGLYGWQSDAMDESSDITFNSFDDAYNDAVEAHNSDNGILMIDGEVVGDFSEDDYPLSNDSFDYDSDIDTSPTDDYYRENDISPKGVLLYDGERETTYVKNKITKVIVEPGVDKIPASAFSECTHLKFVQIPKTVTNIGFGAFYNCISMRSITIPDSVKYIGADAFHNCKGLTSITIPNSVTSLKDWTFAGCKNLTNITIPDSVTSIGRKAFYDCTGLTRIMIPDSVTSIDSDAFENCTGLKYITIPDSVTYLGAGALGGIDNITVYTDSEYVKDYCLEQEENITVKPLR